MKKFSLLFLLAVIALSLMACKEETTVTIIDDNKETPVVENEDVYVAKPSDFNAPYWNNANQMITKAEKEEGLIIMGTINEAYGVSTDLDQIFEKAGVPQGEHFEKHYPDAVIETEGSKYTITLEEGLVLEFEKVGLRIIKDTQGNRYTTPIYPE